MKKPGTDPGATDPSVHPRVGQAFVNQEYIDQINEFNVMLVMNFEKVRPVYDFCLWYAEHCKKHGVEP